VKLFLDSAGLGREVVKFRSKETVFSQGDPAKNVIYIQEGGVKLTVVTEVGSKAVMAILGAGDFFREGCVAGQSVCIATATAVSPITVPLSPTSAPCRPCANELFYRDTDIGMCGARKSVETIRRTAFKLVTEGHPHSLRREYFWLGCDLGWREHEQ